MVSCANRLASKIMKRIFSAGRQLSAARPNDGIVATGACRRPGVSLRARSGPLLGVDRTLVPSLACPATDTGRTLVSGASGLTEGRRLIARMMILGVLAALGAMFFGISDSRGQNRVVVDESVCRSLVVHQPDPGVEFQPGVDVHGRPVAPADLPSSRSLDFDHELAIPVVVDLAERYPGRFAETGLDLRFSLGTLTIDGNEVRLNDTPLGDPLTEAIAALCAEQDVP